MRWIVSLVLAASAAGGSLEEGFRTPPATSRPADGWFLAREVAAAVAGCPPEVRPAFERALAAGAVSATPGDLRRLANWLALTKPGLITSARPAKPPARQPYDALAKPLSDYLARLVFLCSQTEAVGGVFVWNKPAHGVVIYPPSPALYLARRKAGHADLYLAVSQQRIDTVATVTFPRAAAPELWDPEDGSVREATSYYVQGGKTMLNLRLGPHQALFIVLRRPPTKAHVAFASSLLTITRVAPDGAVVEALARGNGRCSVMFASGAMGTAVVEGLPEPLVLEDSWRMKTRSPAKRRGVGIVALRIKRPTAAEEKSLEWTRPDYDDGGWEEFEIGAAPPPTLAQPQWKAQWLQMHGDHQERFFRKAFDLAEVPDLATATITGDNGYELFVNGARVGAQLDNPGDWRNAETYEITKFLRKGRNVLAARLTNQGDVGGLLLEARIRLPSGKLLRVVTDKTWKMAREAPEGWQKPDFNDAAWGGVKPVGRPPAAAPWGVVAGLPPDPEAGESTLYRFKLPAGARKLHLPADLREPRLWVEGREVPIRDATADLAGRVPSRGGVAALRTRGFATLSRPLLCECSESAAGLGSWLLIGYPDYSGMADYTLEFSVPEAYCRERLLLDLGEVGCAASASLNGKDLGVRLWRPYTFDVSGAVRPGRNVLRVTVANTAANASGVDLPAERLASGLIGPVRLVPRRPVAVRAR